jgi:hypothetical protein
MVTQNLGDENKESPRFPKLLLLCVVAPLNLEGFDGLPPGDMSHPKILNFEMWLKFTKI